VAEAHACPVCAADSAQPVVQARGWQYRVCGRCPHWWLSPAPTDEELAAYYESRYEYPAQWVERAVRRQYVPLVRRSGPPAPGVLIDHGCNRGELLAALQPYGWQAYGIEPTEPFATVARGRPGVALAATAAAAQQAGWPLADLVTSFHTIEHVRDPLGELRLLRRLMRPGARLLLLTPNVQSLNARVFPQEWEWTSPPVHLHLFSLTSLALLLVRAGFRLRHCTTRRGNAKAFLFELLRSGVHHLAGTARATTDNPGLQLRATRLWYRAADSILQIVSVPFWTLAPLYGTLALAPEIRAVAEAW